MDFSSKKTGLKNGGDNKQFSQRVNVRKNTDDWLTDKLGVASQIQTSKPIDSIKVNCDIEMEIRKGGEDGLSH